MCVHMSAVLVEASRGRWMPDGGVRGGCEFPALFCPFTMGALGSSGRAKNALKKPLKHLSRPSSYILNHL